MEKIYLDQDGYDNYLKELDEIREKIRNNSSDISEYMSDDAYGDTWHDNFAYEQAIKKENALFYEYKKKLEGLNYIEIVDVNTLKECVDIGAVVEIKFDDESESEFYKITGNTVSTVENGMVAITINSPLGKNIFKKKKNESFKFEVDSQIISGYIVNINYM